MPMTKPNLIAATAVMVLTATPQIDLAAPLSAEQAPVAVAQAMVPPTGMNDGANPMPMPDRMQRRFPQAVRVGDLIGLPVLDMDASTLGYVLAVTHTQQNKIALIVSYSRWFGWFDSLARPVAVPIEAVGIEGRRLVSLDMAPSEYLAAPTWQGGAADELPADAVIRIALGRN
jgi:hypothetical protein